MKKRFSMLVSAVEPSGDRLAGALISEMNKTHNVYAEGITGPIMRAAGVRTLARMEDLSAMGIVEVVKKLPALSKARKVLRRAMHDELDCVLGVDAPDFHLPVLSEAKKRNLLSIGYVSPQIWAWRPDRAKKIATQVDRLLCLFDFEPRMYPEDFDAIWVGHPIMEWTQKRKRHRRNLFGLLPGSREQEVRRHLPIYLETAKRVRQQIPSAEFVISCPSHISLPELPAYMEVRHNGAEAMKEVQAALSKSGTITLELAIMGVPTVVAHQVHPLTHFIGRRLVKGIEHIALPNILSGKMVVPEYLQNLQPQTLATELLRAKEQNPDLTSITREHPIRTAIEAITRK